MTAPIEEHAGGNRAVPFFCPYCGDEDLVPAGPEAGAWECRSCTRAFMLRSLSREGA